MKDFNLAGLAGQRKPRVVPVIVHRFDGLVEWQDASILIQPLRHTSNW